MTSKLASNFKWILFQNKISIEIPLKEKKSILSKIELSYALRALVSNLLELFTF